MAGLTDMPFRILCARGGAGLVCSEMVSSNALHHQDKKSFRLLRTDPEEHPVAIQIFGADPANLAEAAHLAEKAGADIIDINCGCPVPKITKTGAGMALMKNESLFEKCIDSVIRSVRIPVTVKMRVGLLKQKKLSLHFAKIAETLGVNALFIHARYGEDGRKGPADLETLAETVSSVRIPVFGNGGIKTAEDVSTYVQRTGCAGVMIGQAAIGNPRIFSEIILNKPSENTPESLRDKFNQIRTHAMMNVAHYGEKLGILRIRKFIPGYLRSSPYAVVMRKQLYSVCTLDLFNAILSDFEQKMTS